LINTIAFTQGGTVDLYTWVEERQNVEKQSGVADKSVWNLDSLGSEFHMVSILSDVGNFGFGDGRESSNKTNQPIWNNDLIFFMGLYDGLPKNIFHNAVVNDIFEKNMESGMMREQIIIFPGGGYFKGGYGRIDLVQIDNVNSSVEIWDVKPDNPRGIAQGLIQIEKYTQVGNILSNNNLRGLPLIAGGPIPDGNVTVVTPGSTYDVNYRSIHSGIIVYDFEEKKEPILASNPEESQIKAPSVPALIPILVPRPMPKPISIPIFLPGGGGGSTIHRY